MSQCPGNFHLQGAKINCNENKNGDLINWSVVGFLNSGQQLNFFSLFAIKIRVCFFIEDYGQWSV